MNDYKTLFEVSKKLNEKRDGFVRFWIDPQGKFIPVEYHEEYAKEKFPQTKVMTNQDLYHFMFTNKYVRFVIEHDKVWFEYSRANFIIPPTNVQMRELKNFAIENGKTLFDGTKNKEIELNEIKG